MVEERTRFIEEMKELPAERLVFLDESGVHTQMSRATGWSPRGQRVTLQAATRGSKLTVIGAIALDGVRGKRTLKGSMSGDDFKLFVEEDLVPNLRPGDLVFMDQLRAHKVAGICELIEGAGAEVRFLPRYSPELNPIEMCWSVLKGYIRRAAPRALDRLLQAVERAWELVTAELCGSCTQHCGYAVAST